MYKFEIELEIDKIKSKRNMWLAVIAIFCVPNTIAGIIAGEYVFVFYFFLFWGVIAYFVYNAKQKKIDVLLDEIEELDASEEAEQKGQEENKSKIEQYITGLQLKVNELSPIIQNERFDDGPLTVDLVDKPYKSIISESLFEGIKDITISLLVLVKSICQHEKFLAQMRRMSNTEADFNAYWFNVKAMLVKDILMSYRNMGYSKKTGFSTIQGQILYLIIRICSDDEEKFDFSYDDLEYDMTFEDTSNLFIRNVNKQLNIYSDLKAEASHKEGFDDFNLSLLFAVFDDDVEEYFRMLMFRLNQLIAKADGKLTDIERAWLKQILKNQELLEEQYVDENGTPLPKQAKKEWIAKAEQNIDDIKRTRRNKPKGVTAHSVNESIISPIDELNELIGLSETKKEITTLSNYIQMKLKRDEMGMKSPNLSLHCVFTGNPGTGKTTVARILAGIYKDMGLLKKGHLVETDRSGLIAEYVGQTAVKTNKKIDEALDGVLFIDEAYSLVQGAKEDYGPEAISTLLKRMEDDRDRLVVIVAGYTKEMEDFINSNPGLQSRFNRYIHFTDYTAEELYDIFCLQVKKNEYTISEEASNRLKMILADALAHKEKDFGNARFVRNLFEKVIEHQANRLANEPNLTKELLAELREEDFNL